MNKVICISRQYGSGGRAIGKLLAEKLGYKFYDSKLVNMAAQKGAIPLESAQEADEKPVNPWLYTPFYNGVYSNNFGQSDTEKMYRLTSDVIREEALKNNCIIVGRAAEAVLEGQDGVEIMKLFIWAPKDWRAQRLIETEGYTNKKEALEAMKKTDTRRSKYYTFYTDRPFDLFTSYDLCLDSSFLGIEKSADILAEMISTAFNSKK